MFPGTGHSFFVLLSAALLGASTASLRDYTQDLEALLISKPARLNPEMLSMYQDHVMKKHAAVATSHAPGPDIDEAEDGFPGSVKQSK